MSLTRKILFDRLPCKLLILTLALVSAILGLAGPIFQKTFVDSLVGLNANQSLNLSHSFLQLLWFFMCFSGSIALQLIAFYIGQREATRVQQDLGHKLYTQMLSLKSDRLQGTQVGEIVSLYTTETSGAAGMIDLVWTSGSITLFPLLLAPFMLQKLLNVSIGPLLITMLLSLGIMLFLSERQSRFFSNMKRLAAERTGLVNEWIQNIRALRALGWIAAFEQRIFAKRIAETANRTAMVANGQTMASMGASVGFLLNLAGIYALVQMRPEGHLTPGELTATFWALGVYLAKPLRGMPWILTFTMDAYTSIQRIERFLDLRSDNIKVKDMDPRNEDHPHFLEIQNLSLNIGGKDLLKNISLSIDKPEFVAIVGSVGSGKTLFVQSLLGEVPARFDSYSLMGQSMASVDEATIKSHFSLVPQDGFIASTSIRNNILLEYERPQNVAPLKGAVRSALSHARFDLNAEGFADKEDTIVGERGVNLSGGQRQRLGLARALYADRPVLVMDDSLSAIDVNTENDMINSLFKSELKNKLVLLITHRHLMLPLSDRLLFFKDGHLAGNGSYEELLQSSPEFCAFIKDEQKKEANPHELS